VYKNISSLYNFRPKSKNRQRKKMWYLIESKSSKRKEIMKPPQNQHSRIHSLSLAISSLLITGRHSGTEEISVATKRLIGGPKVVFIPTPDPAEVLLEEVKRWEARHPGYNLKIQYPHTGLGEQFNSLVVEQKEGSAQKFKHKGMKTSPRLWQPNGQVPKQKKDITTKPKSPYR